MIEIKGLTKDYGKVRALDRVDLKIQDGEWVSIMGPSGSGKTTLLNHLGGLERATEGSVVIDGTPIMSLGSQALVRFRKDHIGEVFQGFYLIPYLTALENVMVAQYFHSMPDEKEALGALKEVGLGDRAHHLPEELSTGEQQRVAFVRALINQPKILLADEPTGNLDEENEAIIMNLLEGFHKGDGTVILATHDPGIGERGDRQIFLDHGRIVGSTTSEDRADQEREELLRELWIEKEKARARVEPLRMDEGLLNDLVRSGFGRLEGKTFLFEEVGELKGRELTRRHRIAERLFSDVFRIDNNRVDDLAHRFDHLLNPEMTENLCIFMNHPRTCPHGDPIPTGRCCTRRW